MFWGKHCQICPSELFCTISVHAIKKKNKKTEYIPSDLKTLFIVCYFIKWFTPEGVVIDTVGE